MQLNWPKKARRYEKQRGHFHRHYQDHHLCGLYFLCDTKHIPVLGHVHERDPGYLAGKSFNPLTGFMNSMIISCGATLCAIYFSSLTAYGLVAYSWKLRQPFFTFIMAVLMIPAQVSIIGFYQFMYSIHWTNTFWPLILPAIASPAMVFFMRQYLLATLSLDIVNSARIDGAGEFYTFNRIILPIMKPALATQAIFSFVFSWNNLFVPLILLTDNKKYTMPIMVSLLRGDIYKTEYGSVYLGLALTVLPLFVFYFILSKYIIGGVALGALKE
jgi:multiple sugar transport system permease protein